MLWIQKWDYILKGCISLKSFHLCAWVCLCRGGDVYVLTTVFSPLCLAVTLEQGQCNGRQWSQHPLRSPEGRDGLLRTLEREVYTQTVWENMYGVPGRTEKISTKNLHYILRLTLCLLLRLLLFSPNLRAVFSPCLYFPLLCKSTNKQMGPNET